MSTRSSTKKESKLLRQAPRQAVPPNTSVTDHPVVQTGASSTPPSPTSSSPPSSSSSSSASVKRRPSGAVTSAKQDRPPTSGTGKPAAATTSGSATSRGKKPVASNKPAAAPTSPKKPSKPTAVSPNRKKPSKPAAAPTSRKKPSKPAAVSSSRKKPLASNKGKPAAPTSCKKPLAASKGKSAAVPIRRRKPLASSRSAAAPKSSSNRKPSPPLTSSKGKADTKATAPKTKARRRGRAPRRKAPDCLSGVSAAVVEVHILVYLEGHDVLHSVPLACRVLARCCRARSPLWASLLAQLRHNVAASPHPSAPPALPSKTGARGMYAALLAWFRREVLSDQLGSVFSKARASAEVSQISSGSSTANSLRLEMQQHRSMWRAHDAFLQWEYAIRWLSGRTVTVTAVQPRSFRWNLTVDLPNSSVLDRAFGNRSMQFQLLRRSRYLGGNYEVILELTEPELGKRVSQALSERDTDALNCPSVVPVQVNPWLWVTADPDAKGSRAWATAALTWIPQPKRNIRRGTSLARGLAITLRAGAKTILWDGVFFDGRAMASRGEASFERYGRFKGRPYVRWAWGPLSGRWTDHVIVDTWQGSAIRPLVRQSVVDLGFDSDLGERQSFTVCLSPLAFTLVFHVGREDTLVEAELGSAKAK